MRNAILNKENGPQFGGELGRTNQQKRDNFSALGEICRTSFRGKHAFRGFVHFLDWDSISSQIITDPKQ